MALAWVLEDARDDRAERARPKTRRPEPGLRPSEASDPAEGAHRQFSVLVTDDHPGMRSTLRDILQAEGYRIVEAEDGQVALGLLQTQVFDVLILDLAMPRADGVSLLRQIDVPPPMVIVCSAFSHYSPDGVRDEFGMKVFHYMRKPVPPSDLIVAVNEAVAELDR